MNKTALIEAWAAVRAQLLASARLRIGLLAILALLWSYALLAGLDADEARQRGLASQQDALDRVRSLQLERDWPMRANDAQQHVTALRSLLWPETDRGLAEAAFQDWVRATASRSGLFMRELVLTPAVLQSTPGAAPAPLAVRARLVAEFNRPAVMAFLAELESGERRVLVDRMLLRLHTQPATAELDLRIHLSPQTGGTK